MSEPDALSALLGERMERQHRELLKATIAAGVIASASTAPKPPDITAEEFVDKVCVGAWVIAGRALDIRDELIKQGKLQP